MSWDQRTQDRAFYVVLAISTLTVVALFWPYIDVLVFATVTASVASPVQEKLLAAIRRAPRIARVLDLLGGASLWSALAVALLLALVVFIPLTLVALQFVAEAIHLVDRAAEWVASGRLDVMLQDLRSALRPESLPPWLAPYLPQDVDLFESLAAPLRTGLTGSLGVLSNTLPGLLGSLASGLIDGTLYVLAVITMLAEGPAIMKFLYRLSPLDDDYERRLAGVFREFSVNMVVGSLATAFAQGVVATLGFWWVGLPRPVFFGVLTAVASFVPVVGTAVVVAPIVAYVAGEHGVGTGLGLLVYALVVIGSIDNVLRPLFMRGSSAIHPLLIFLAVFGGMAWMGITGVLVGPVLVAFFLALTRIRDEEFGGHPSRFPMS